MATANPFAFRMTKKEEKRSLGGNTEDLKRNLQRRRPPTEYPDKWSGYQPRIQANQSMKPIIHLDQLMQINPSPPIPILGYVMCNQSNANVMKLKFAVATRSRDLLSNRQHKPDPLPIPSLPPRALRLLPMRIKVQLTDLCLVLLLDAPHIRARFSPRPR